MHQHESLTKLCDEFLQKHRRRLKWNTLQQTEIALKHLCGSVGDTDPKALTFGHADDFQSELAGRLKATSANDYIKAVRSVFGWAEHRGYVGFNPFAGIRLLKVPEKKIVTYSAEQVEAMLGAAANDIERARILAAATAGLRKTEVQNVTFDDISVRTISVQSKEDDFENGIWSWCAKNYETRTVPLSPRLSNLLLMVRMQLPAGQPYPFLTERQYFNMLRKMRAGRLTERHRLSPCSSWRWFQAILDQCKIKDRCYHDLRVTAISNWACGGKDGKPMPAHEVRILAGHKNIETTLRYYMAIGPDLIERAASCGVVV